jgi:ABC-type polysaccharide/polyol phosphate transport system ATPase subunit
VRQGARRFVVTDLQIRSSYRHPYLCLGALTVALSVAWLVLRPNRPLQATKLAAVDFEDVHKRYRVYQQRNRSLKDILIQRRLGEWEDRWALKGVTFRVDAGGSLGLVGPNGAGKSTALKLLARILLPDRGRVRTEGRIGSLIELGAGFHPESTGRENVFLNASLLGLPEREIRSRLDAIVEFAGLSDVIDQPLRTYSSGMQVRLGFSVAVHTDPQVLLLDEVLAVGDEEFQLRCFEFIRRFQHDGGTLLFVSHSMDAIREVCSEAAWIEHGVLQEYGPSADVVAAYLERVHEAWSAGVEPDERGGEAPAVVLGAARLLDTGGDPAEIFDTGAGLCIEIPFRRRREVPDPVFGIAIHRLDGVVVYGTNTRADKVEIGTLPEQGRARFRLPRLELLAGRYLLTVGVFSGTLIAIDYHDQRYSFRVRSEGQDQGVVRLKHHWEIKPDQPD